MKASVGDRLVLASSVVDGVVRDGTVVEIRHDDGSPPFMVEWSDTGERSLVFPGPDARVVHPGDAPPEAAPPPVLAQAATWRVRIDVLHEGQETTAHAVLVAGDPDRTGAVGHAHQSPTDPPAPMIGEEVAVARALRHLADRLIDAAEERIEDSTGRPARVH